MIIIILIDGVHDAGWIHASSGGATARSRESGQRVTGIRLAWFKQDTIDCATYRCQEGRCQSRRFTAAERTRAVY